MELTELVAFCRKNGITSLKTPDGHEITLAPEVPPAPLAPEAVDGPDPDEVGLTGQTRRQQLELFGTVFESDFPRKR